MNSYLTKNENTHKVTTPYYPQANGRVEQLNGNLLQIIRKLINNKPKELWNQFLPQALIIYCIQNNRTTGYSPFELTYRYQLKIKYKKMGPYIDAPKWSVVPKHTTNHSEINKRKPKKEATGNYNQPSQSWHLKKEIMCGSLQVIPRS